MSKILEKRQLTRETVLMKVEAPLIANKALPGQFIIFRVEEGGERVPLTIAGVDPSEGSVTIIFQMVGKSTMRLGAKKPVNRSPTSSDRLVNRPNSIHIRARKSPSLAADSASPSPTRKRLIFTKSARTSMSSPVIEA